MMAHPLALQLRNLQSLAESVAAAINGARREENRMVSVNMTAGRLPRTAVPAAGCSARAAVT